MVLFAIAVIMTFNMIVIMSKLDGLTMNTTAFEGYSAINGPHPIYIPVSIPWFGDNTIELFTIDFPFDLSGKFFINLFISNLILT